MKRPAAVARAAPKKRPATQSRDQVPERVDHEFPEPNAWETPSLPSLGRDLNVAVPCTGIDGAGVALKKLKVPFKASMVYDLDARYHDYLSEHLPEGTTLHLGKEDGDVCKLEPEMVERPVDGLISGAPLPALGGTGAEGREAGPAGPGLPGSCQPRYPVGEVRRTGLHLPGKRQGHPRSKRLYRRQLHAVPAGGVKEGGRRVCLGVQGAQGASLRARAAEDESASTSKSNIVPQCFLACSFSRLYKKMSLATYPKP